MRQARGFNWKVRTHATLVTMNFTQECNQNDDLIESKRHVSLFEESGSACIYWRIYINKYPQSSYLTQRYSARDEKCLSAITPRLIILETKLGIYVTGSKFPLMTTQSQRGIY